MFLEKIFFILLLLVYCFIVYNYSNNYIISQKKFPLFFHPSPIRNDLSIWLLQLSSFSAPAKQDSKGDGDPSYHEKQIRIHPKGRRHLLPGVPSDPPGIDEDRVPQKTSRRRKDKKRHKRHPGNPCRDGDQAADDGDQPAQEHRRSPAFPEPSFRKIHIFQVEVKQMSDLSAEQFPEHLIRQKPSHAV